MQKFTRRRTSHFITFLSLLLCTFAGMVARAQVSVTATAGTSGPTAYTTLKGAFDAINLGTHQGAVTITITASTTETATAVINGSGSGSASYTSVLVKPGTGAMPTISGTLTSMPLIKLNGASNVRFNGSNNGTTTRDLTLTNAATTGPYVMVIGSVGTTGITADSVKNCVITEGAAGATAILVGDATAIGSPGYFSNLGFVNNSIQRTFIGFYLYGATTATGTGCAITGNDMSAGGTMASRYCGVYMFRVNGCTISNNTFGNFEQVNAETDRGVWLDAYNTNTVITGNTITGLGYTGISAFAPIGMTIAPLTTAANISISGNTITNLSSAGTATTMGIYFSTAASGITIAKNQISNIKNTNTTGYGAAGILLAGGLTASAVNVANNFVWDVAAYGTNSWISAGNGNGIVAESGGGYNIDYNSVWLNTNQTLTTGTRAAAVLITSGVTATASINLRNNLLINTQTIGNANSRLALAVTAATNVFNTFNYNDYYSTSGNLAGQGTNTTIWTTIPQIQTNMGQNANSVSIQPAFTSATDLHLPGTSNALLDNIGVAITGITDDIDGQTRSATPDMGADEFTACATVTIGTQPSNVTLCEGGNTSFTVATTNATIYQWQVNTGTGFTNIANGGAYSGAATATLSVTSATPAMSGYIYRVQVSAAAACPQVASNAVTLTVNPVPNVTVTASGSTSFCTGGSVTLSVPTGSNLGYQWKNGTNNIPGANTNSYTATAAGNYSITVVNTSTLCTATSTITAVSVGAGPVAVITPSGTVAICQGTGTTLSAGTSNGVTYQWSLNSNPINGATANTYSTSVAGNYTVLVTSGPGCNTTSAATTVSVNPLPAATATPAGSTAICQGSSVMLNANTGSGLAYQWLLNNALIAGATGASYNANAAGTYRVKVTSTATGCKDSSAPVIITVNPLPSASITPTAPTPVCQGDTSLLTANSGTGFTYQWSLNAAAISNNATGGTYKAYTAGSYTVTVTDANGCQKTSQPVSLTVNPAPPAIITYNSPLAFCDGGAIVLHAFPGTGLTYQWYKNGSPLTGITGIDYIVSQGGNYTILVTNSLGCTATSSPLPVTVYALPVPVISRNGNVLSTGNFNSYQWYLNNVTIGSGNQQFYTVQANGAYKVKVTTADGCEGTSEIYFFNGLSVGGVAGDKIELLVYPNPATNAVTIENKSSLRVWSVSLINSFGSIVSEAPVSGMANKATLLLGGIANGIYYLRIATESGVVLRKLEVLR